MRRLLTAVFAFLALAAAAATAPASGYVQIQGQGGYQGTGPQLYGANDYSQSTGWIPTETVCTHQAGSFTKYCDRRTTSYYRDTVVASDPIVSLTSVFAGETGYTATPNTGYGAWVTNSTLPAGRWIASGSQTCTTTRDYQDYLESRSSSTGPWSGSYQYRGYTSSDCGGGSTYNYGSGAPPTFTSGSASEISEHTARVGFGFVSHGANVDYHVEWGLTDGYGSSTDSVNHVATSNTREVPGSAELTGLDPNTTYHWRLVARSNGGTLVSPDQSFTTTSASVPADTAPPAISLDGASGVVTTATPTLSFTTDEPATFTCAVDEGAYEPCGTELATAGSFTPAALGEGPHVLKVKAKDAAGNESAVPATSAVIVDLEAPTVTVSHGANANGWNTEAPVTLSVVTTDAATPVASVTCIDDQPLQGSEVTGDGVHEITCLATDGAGRVGTGSDTVRIDTKAPSLTVSHTADTDDGWNTSSPVQLDVQSGDDGSGRAGQAICTDNGVGIGRGLRVFGDGVHAIECTATDVAGNVTTATDTVRIDTTGPVVSVPEDVSWEADGPGGAMVTYDDATAEDAVTAPSCTPASGGQFPIGETTVTCTASDALGNEGSATFTVTVQDTAGPVVTVGDRAVEATGPDGAAVDLGATATDAVDGALDATCTPASGSTFALGQTEVTCTATDAADNLGADTATISVVDTTAPVVTIDDCPSAVRKGSRYDVGWTASDRVGVTPSGQKTLATGTVGPQSVTVDVADAAGNTGSAVCSYLVVTAPGTTSQPTTTKTNTRDAFSLTWTRPAADAGAALTYTVSRRAVSGEDWEQVAGGLTSPRIDFTAADPQPEGAWVYRVVAADHGVPSAPSKPSQAIYVDRTAPEAPVLSVAGGQTPVVIGGVDWYRDSAMVAVAAQDNPGGGGLKTFISPFKLAADGRQTATRTVTDRAGNVSPAGSITVAVDSKAPKLVVNCPTAAITRGADRAIGWKASDAGSGLVGPATGRAALATSTAGEKTLEISASDGVDHVTTVACRYVVR